MMSMPPPLCRFHNLLVGLNKKLVKCLACNMYTNVFEHGPKNILFSSFNKVWFDYLHHKRIFRRVFRIQYNTLLTASHGHFSVTIYNNKR